jgi:hypothetical protein
MNHVRRLIVCVAAVFFVTPVRAADEPAKSLLGVNVAWLQYYSPMCATIDAIKSSQRFGSPRNPGDGRCKLDENGWPTEDFGVVIAADVAGLHGTYKLSCEGKANVVGLGRWNAVKNLAFDGKTTTADVEYRGGGGAFALAFTGTSGGVRNLKLLRPGYASDEGVFTKEYLASKEPFGAMRLMDWGRTNDSKVSRWEERCKPTDAQWSIKGGPWEPWLDYAAKHHKDLWICVPHMADDDYVESLALLCKQHLGDAPVNLYLEDSNEYWNRQFKQYQWIGEQAKSHADEWKLNDPPYAGDLRHRYHARRTIEIGRIFRDVLGGNDARIRPVLTGQVAGYANTEDAVKWVETQYGPLKDHVYGIACAPYFGNYGPATNVASTADELADHLLAAAKKYSTPASPTAAATAKFHALAKSHGVHSLAYEGGADLGGPPGKMDQKLAQRYVAVRAEAQTRPSTGQAITEYLEWWFNSGGDEFFYFNDFSPYARSGYWGLSNVPGKIDTPKYQAAIEVAKKHPAPGADAGK